MRLYAPPVLGSPRLGQLQNLFSGGLTQDVAQQIVAAADAPTRAIIRDERNRLAEGLIGGLPFAALAGISAVGTYYLVPDESKTAKFMGYAVAFASLGIGGIWTFSKITETAPPAAASMPAPAVVQQAAQALVSAADPAVRKIVDEERSRIAEAAQAGLPFAAAGAVALLASATLIPDDSVMYKVGGYVASIGLFTLGAYVALNKEQS